MKPAFNPFILKGYTEPEYFCDREDETKELIDRAINGVNTTLLSIRRMGKTGLIHHTFNNLPPNGHLKGIYIDIYATQNLSEFTNLVVSSILQTFPPTKSLGKKFMSFLKSFRPMIAYDPYTGAPEVTLNFAEPIQCEHTLKSMFEFLGRQKEQIIVAFDEFQQISNYPEKNTEALLRTIIQQVQNIQFIFSGSHKHLLVEMFNSAKRPFFSSASPLYLYRIPKEKYQPFLIETFAKHGKKLSEEGAQFILNWTKCHTYYTQAFCNKLFAMTRRGTIQMSDINYACDQLLQEQDIVFFQYRNLLTKNQWQLLSAIAKEDSVNEPTGFAFVSKYNLGNPASVRRSLMSLVEKEMVVEYNYTDKKTEYQVYDCFLSRWLQRQY